MAGGCAAASQDKKRKGGGRRSSWWKNNNHNEDTAPQQRTAAALAKKKEEGGEERGGRRRAKEGDEEISWCTSIASSLAIKNKEILSSYSLLLLLLLWSLRAWLSLVLVLLRRLIKFVGVFFNYDAWWWSEQQITKYEVYDKYILLPSYFSERYEILLCLTNIIILKLAKTKRIFKSRNKSSSINNKYTVESCT